MEVRHVSGLLNTWFNVELGNVITSPKDPSDRYVSRVQTERERWFVSVYEHRSFEKCQCVCRGGWAAPGGSGVLSDTREEMNCDSVIRRA